MQAVPSARMQRGGLRVAAKGIGTRLQQRRHPGSANGNAGAVNAAAVPVGIIGADCYDDAVGDAVLMVL